MIVKKSNPIYDLDVELYMLPKLSRQDESRSYREIDSQKIFGLFVNRILLVNAGSVEKYARLRSIKFRCICCEQQLPFVPRTVNLYDKSPLKIIREVLPTGIIPIKHRFVNINKRSAIYYILVHEACRSTLELNPLVYLPKLEAIAAKWDNTIIKVP